MIPDERTASGSTALRPDGAVAPAPPRRQPDRMRSVLAAVDELRAHVGTCERMHAHQLAAAATGWPQSARNLLHYLAVRGHDLRPLQRELARLGLASLGLMESCTLFTLDAVASALRRMLGEPALPPVDQALVPDADSGPRLLQAHALELLGPPPEGRGVRVMVTMGSEAADDAAGVRELVAAGMDLARINTAHDDPERWTRMVQHVRAAAEELGRPCRILVDLAGPKLRTGPLQPGVAVRRARPERDELGRVRVPARVWFHAPDLTPPRGPAGAVSLPIVGNELRDVRPGDEIALRDTRGRRRVFAVRTVAGRSFLAEGDRTSYCVPGLELAFLRHGIEIGRARVAPFPPLPGRLGLRVGDEFLLTRAQTPGGMAAAGEGIRGRIPCTLAAVFDCARAGDPIWFDDGRLGGRVVGHAGPDLRIRITDAPPQGFALRAEKGINLPETDLATPALTERDIGCLDWIASHADVVALSFARSPADVRQLLEQLRARGAGHLGVVLKIETRRGFERLPAMLLEGMRSPPLGVMVARGDLAVEVGFARLAELQEEILWLCEAAHVPVIWATQVLETLARTGQPSRAEVSDAAMGVRAECVMLNKGPFAADAVRFLGNVLGKMQAHHEKKRSLLRRLSVADAIR